jgi:tetratricopeptide (TPR) repeat protein
MVNKAVNFHKKAEKLREQDKHLQALELCDEALLAYQQEKNYFGISSLLQSRILIYKHLFLLTKDSSFYLLAMKDAELSLLISQKHKLSNLHVVYFRLGETFMLSNDFSKAILNYKKALELYPKEDSEKGDYRYHLGEALYRNGNKKGGLENLLFGLKTIQRYKLKTDSFLINVWESGNYLRLTELLKKDNPKQSKEYLLKAKQIINSDERLIIRKRQLQKLEL